MSTLHLTGSALHFHRLTSFSAATVRQYSNVLAESVMTCTHLYAHIYPHVDARILTHCRNTHKFPTFFKSEKLF